MGVELIEGAFRELYPNRQFNYTARLPYSAKFKGYNADIRSILIIGMSNLGRVTDTKSRIFNIPTYRALTSKKRTV